MHDAIIEINKWYINEEKMFTVEYLAIRNNTIYTKK